MKVGEVREGARAFLDAEAPEPSCAVAGCEAGGISPVVVFHTWILACVCKGATCSAFIDQIQPS